MQNRQNTQHGLTLLELMLAIALLVAVGAVLATSIFQTSATDDRILSRFNARMQERIIENLITRDLRAAIYLADYAKSGLKNKDIQEKLDSGILGIDGVDYVETEAGETQKVDTDQIHLHVHLFAVQTALESRLEDPEVHEISYFLQKSEESKGLFKLYRRESFYLDEGFSEQGLQDRVITLPGSKVSHTLLSERITGFSLEYLSDEVDAQPEQSWSSKKAKAGKELPTGVQVRIDLVNADGRQSSKQFLVRIRPPLGNNILWKF